jgi:hypothetical protein
MENVQFGGKVGPLRDPTSGQSVGGDMYGTFSFRASGDEAAVQQALREAVTLGVNQVIAHKLAANQVAIPTIPGSVPYYVQEIIAAAQAARFGAEITALTLTVNMENPYAAGAASPGLAPGMPANPMQAMQNAFAQEAKDRLDPNNYEVRAKINVGGFKINASTDGGIDTDGLKNQVKDKVKTEIIWYGIGCVVVGLVLVLLGGIGIYAYGTVTGGSAPTGAGKAAAWDGKSTYTCGGNDNVKLTGVTANLPSSSAIKAAGNCKLNDRSQFA